MKLSQKIDKLIKSDITVYQIAKDTGVSQASLTNMRNGKKEINNLRLETAEKLGDYWDKIQKRGQ